MKLEAVDHSGVDTDQGTSMGRQASAANPDHGQADEDQFAAGIVQKLNSQALSGKIENLVIIAAPRALGEMRKHYHKALSAILLSEIAKDLTGHPLADIEKRWQPDNPVMTNARPATPLTALRSALLLLLPAAWLAGAAPAMAAGDAPAADGPVARGYALVETHCSRCHAVAATGASPLAIAPAFRDLHTRYDVGLLGEALVEGIATAHPDMPEFEFDPVEAEAIIAYLKSLEP